MSIKHAVLGLLSEQPMHGYRLKEAFDERVGGLWGLTTGQIYQTLKALERAALLEGRGERVGARPARRIYSLTPQGTRALNAWLDETPAPWTRAATTPRAGSGARPQGAVVVRAGPQ